MRCSGVVSGATSYRGLRLHLSNIERRQRSVLADFEVCNRRLRWMRADALGVLRANHRVVGMGMPVNRRSVLTGHWRTVLRVMVHRDEIMLVAPVCATPVEAAGGAETDLPTMPVR